MKILIDRHIPFIEGIIEPYAEVQYLEPEEFTPTKVRDATALIIRTRTRCDASLLEGSAVRFIATATIGHDHIDKAYCATRGISWTNAPGCNAQGVCDYIEAAVDKIETTLPASATPPTIGVVGVGNVGSKVVEMAQRRGYRVVVSDPPKGMGISLELLVRQADIITFHTPLTREGQFATYHLCDAHLLSLCKPQACIINAARGGVVDEKAALDSSNAGKTYVIDTWEGEPHINTDMLRRCLIGTYHIAGYTVQGKVNATNMCLAALSVFLGIEQLAIPQHDIPLPTKQPHDWLEHIDRQLRLSPADFEHLREKYQLR